MPVFTIETPTGAKLDIEAANEQAAIAGAQEWHQQQSAQKKPTVGEYATDAIKSVPHGMLDRIGAMLSASGNAADLEMSGGQANPDNPTPEQATGALKQNVTGETHAPQTSAGKIGAAVGGAVVDPTSYIGPGSLLLKAGLAAGAGAGGEIGRQAAEGTPYEVPAQIAGSVAGGVAPLGLSALRAAPAAIPAPSRGMVGLAGDSAYAQGRNVDAAISPQVIDQIVQRSRNDLYNRSITPRLAPEAHDTLDNLAATAAAGGALDMKGLSALRQELSQVRQAGGHNSAAGNAIGTALDDTIADLGNFRPIGTPYNPANYVTRGTVQDVQDAAAHFRRGDQHYASAMRDDLVTGKIDTATLKAATEHSGMNLDNKLRSQIASILQSDELRQGFSAPEIAAMREIAHGSNGANALRQLGNRLGGGGGFVSTALAAAGAAAAGPLGALAGLSGHGVRMVANANTLRKAQELSNMVRMRSPIGQSIVQPTRPRLPQGLPTAALLRALALSQPASQ